MRKCCSSSSHKKNRKRSRNSSLTLDSHHFSMPRNNKESEADIVFETTARYSPCLVVTWLIGPTVLTVMLVVSILTATPLLDDWGDDEENDDRINDDDDDDDDFWKMAPFFGFLLLLVSVLYGTFLPGRLVLRGDGTLEIHTTCRVWHMDQATSAERVGCCDQGAPCVCKMATAWVGWVRIRRCNKTQCSVLLTPCDPQGLIDAVNNRIASSDRQRV